MVYSSSAIAFTVFDDPPSHVIDAAAKLCRERGVDAVPAIGGGSALHTATSSISQNPG
ncbi:iron-containing alcohol dehydrogenase [Rhizobium laguerreae]